MEPHPLLGAGAAIGGAGLGLALLLDTYSGLPAADAIFDMLMGDAVPPRRKFIQTHARNVRNLDV